MYYYTERKSYFFKDQDRLQSLLQILGSTRFFSQSKPVLQQSSLEDILSCK
jgi:hypothetical protein